MDNQNQPVILAVDDDGGVLRRIESIVADENWQAETFATGRAALDYFQTGAVACAIVDLGLPDMNGMEVLKRMKADKSLTPILVLTGQHYNVDNAIEATRHGALNFLDKPISQVSLVQNIKHALEFVELQQDNRDLRRLSFASSGVIGDSPAMQDVFRRVEDYLDLNYSILITGETGPGKSLLARTIHSLSSRRDKPFYTIDCSQLSEELFISDVFGHIYRFS